MKLASDIIKTILVKSYKGTSCILWDFKICAWGYCCGCSLNQDAVKMNQLQNLLHDALISTEHVQQCAIIRRKDCSVRASSVGFNLYQDQVQLLLDAFKNPPQTREEGIYFDDRQYKCVRADKTSVYGKCENRGLVLVKTLTLLVIATYSDSMYPSVCVEAVEKLADYFKEKGK